jgi:hypothetical protein
MKIKFMQLRSIEARRYSDMHPDKPQQIRIDHNSTITHVLYREGNDSSVDFQYTANYGPLGIIKFEGFLVYEHPDAKMLSDKWNDTRKMPDNVASLIHTTIMHFCVPEAVSIAKSLGLPPPIPLPQVRLGNDAKQGRVGGPEVA